AAAEAHLAIESWSTRRQTHQNRGDKEHRHGGYQAEQSQRKVDRSFEQSTPQPGWPKSARFDPEYNRVRAARSILGGMTRNRHERSSLHGVGTAGDVKGG